MINGNDPERSSPSMDSEESRWGVPGTAYNSFGVKLPSPKHTNRHRFYLQDIEHRKTKRRPKGKVMQRGRAEEGDIKNEQEALEATGQDEDPKNAVSQASPKAERGETLEEGPHLLQFPTDVRPDPTPAASTDDKLCLTPCMCYRHIDNLAEELRLEFQELRNLVNSLPAAVAVTVTQVRSPEPTPGTSSDSPGIRSPSLFEAARQRNLALFKTILKKDQENLMLIDYIKELDSTETIVHYLILLSKNDKDDAVLNMLEALYKHLPKGKPATGREVNYINILSTISMFFRKKRNKIEPAPQGTGPKDMLSLLRHQDSKGRTPIQLAANIAPATVMKVILDHPPYKEKINDLPKHCQKGLSKNDAIYRVDELDGIHLKSSVAVIERVVMKPAREATKLLQLEPLRSMVLLKWDRYSKWYIASFFMYLLFMCLCTVCVLFRPIGKSSVREMYMTVGDYFRLAGEVVILCSPLVVIYAEARDMKRHKWVWPNPRNRAGMFRAINCLFVSLLVMGFVFRFCLDPSEDIVLPFALFLGWLNAISFLSAWQRCGMFPIILHEALVEDLVASFLSVYLMMLIGGATATFCAYQTAEQPVPELSDIWRSLFNVFLLTLGMSETGYVTETRMPGVGVALFIMFVWFANILLLNLLLGMVADTYGRVRQKYMDAWLSIQANHALLTERRLPPNLYTRYKDMTPFGKDNEGGNRPTRVEGSEAGPTEFKRTIQNQGISLFKNGKNHYYVVHGRDPENDEMAT